AQPRGAARAVLEVILDTLARIEHGFLAAGHDGLHELRRRAERQRHLRGLEDAEAPARAGADEKETAAVAKRADDQIDAGRDALALLVDGGDDLLVLLAHQIDDVADGHLVDPERRGVDGFSR